MKQSYNSMHSCIMPCMVFKAEDCIYYEINDTLTLETLPPPHFLIKSTWGAQCKGLVVGFMM